MLKRALVIASTMMMATLLMSTVPEVAYAETVDTIDFTGVATVTKSATTNTFAFSFTTNTCQITGDATPATSATSACTVSPNPYNTNISQTPCPGITNLAAGPISFTPASGSGLSTIAGTFTSTNVLGEGVIQGSGITRNGSGSFTATGTQTAVLQSATPGPGGSVTDPPCGSAAGSVYTFKIVGTLTVR